MVTDAVSAMQSGAAVYVIFCVLPGTTNATLDNFVDVLTFVGFINDLNTYGLPFLVVYDVEDGPTCGNWDTLSLSAAEAKLNGFSAEITARANSHGLAGGMGFAADPGKCGTCSTSTTDQVSAWATNSMPYPRIAVEFPQLFGPDVWGSAYRDDWLNVLHIDRFIGVQYSQMNPVMEDCSLSCGFIAQQSLVDAMKNTFYSVTGFLVNIFVWYPRNAPWPP